jgi:PAS domain-containing protein
MIVRVVHAKRPARRRALTASDASASVNGVGGGGVDGAHLGPRFANAAVGFYGLETLIVGWRDGSDIASRGSRTAEVVVTVWQDPESMIRAIGTDDAGFLGALGLDLTIQRAASYELTSRTFASLPRPTSLLRISTLRVRAVGEAEFFDRLRAIQQRFSEQGLIASHIGRRVGPDGIDALVLGVWRDRAAIEAATGQVDAPTYLDDIRPWIDGVAIEVYDALEIAPRLPMSAGPPIMILDESRRVVDLTPAAAAMLGRTQEEAAGVLIEDLAALERPDDAAQWAQLLEDGTDGEKAGSTAWFLPPEGRVLIRWRLRRNVPVPGRHTILVRRSLDAEPSTEELDGALAEAFPGAEVSSAR